MSAASRPDQYVTEVTVSTTDAAGTIGKIGVDFGFVANQVAFANDKASTVYLNLDSSAGSTGGWPIKSNETFSLDVVTGGCSLASTTTSTGDKVRVGAWRH